MTETSSHWDDDPLLLSELVFLAGVVEDRMTSDWIVEFGNGGAGGIFVEIEGGGGGGNGGDCWIKSAGGGGKQSISEIVANVGIPILTDNGGPVGGSGGGGGGGGGLAAGLAIVCFIGGYCVILWLGSNCDNNSGGGGGGACRVTFGEWIFSLGDDSVLYPFNGDFGVPVLLKFIVIDCCSRDDEDDDNAGLPYCTKSEFG